MTNSFHNDNVTSPMVNRLDEEWFSQEIDVLFGVVVACFAILGIIENITVICMFCKCSSAFQTRTMKLLTSLAVSDMIMSIVGGVMFSSSSFNHSWLYGVTGCQIYGFVMFGAGCTDIAHFMVIAIDRLAAITAPIKYKAHKKKTTPTALAIGFSWIYGFIWALLPLIGFQEYTLEGQTSCSINWLSKHPVDVAYTLTIFITTYFIPFLIMLICYSIIFITIKVPKTSFNQGKTSLNKKKLEVECKLLVTLASTMSVYMVIWTPYAIVSMWGIFGDASVIPSSARGFPAVFAKISMFINPILYILGNKYYRNRLKVFLGRSHSEPSTSASQNSGASTGTIEGRVIRITHKYKPETSATNDPDDATNPSIEVAHRATRKYTETSSLRGENDECNEDENPLRFHRPSIASVEPGLDSDTEFVVQTVTSCQRRRSSSSDSSSGLLDEVTPEQAKTEAVTLEDVTKTEVVV